MPPKSQSPGPRSGSAPRQSGGRSSSSTSAPSTTPTDGPRTELQGIRTWVRIRPLGDKGHADGERVEKQLGDFDETMVKIISHDQQDREVAYDYPSRVFPVDCTQEDVGNEVLPDLLHDFWHERSVMIFAYGQTGTGKTTTMFGFPESLTSESEDPGWGLLPRAVHATLQHNAAQAATQMLLLVGSARSRAASAITASVNALAPAVGGPPAGPTRAPCSCFVEGRHPGPAMTPAFGLLRRCSSSSAAEEKNEGDSDSKEPAPKETASDVWHRAVMGRRSRTLPAWHQMLVWLRNWCVKKAALQFVSNMAAKSEIEEGKLEDLEGDVIEGAPLCLHFLANSLALGDGAGGSCQAASSSFGPPHVEDALADKLRETVTSLQESGCQWQWQLEGTPEARLHRLFVIVGASRRGIAPRKDNISVLVAYGQQFVMSHSQRQRFLDKNAGIRARAELLQDLTSADAVLVADVCVTARQQRAFHCPENEQEGTQQEAPKLELGATEEVEHWLRLEMQLSADRSYRAEEEGLPSMRLSSWQVVDWNWLCAGNHPALPRGHWVPF